MNPDWRGGFCIYIAELKPLRENVNYVEMQLTDGYYSNLQGKVIVRKEDVNRLKLKEGIEIAMGVAGKEKLEERKPSAAYVNTVTVGLSTVKGKNIWANVADGAEYIDYVDIAIKFTEIEAEGNLLLVKTTVDGMRLGIGDMLFLTIVKVRMHTQDEE